MLHTIRHKLIERLAGAPIIEDLDVDETIYPMTMTGDIAVKSLEGDVDLFEATAIINADQSLTIANRGSILAYYPAGTYEGVATL